jgi:ABC-type transport system substrate-binding protein
MEIVKKMSKRVLMSRRAMTKVQAAIIAVVIIVAVVVAAYVWWPRPPPGPIMKLLLTYHGPDPDEMKVAELMKAELAKLGIELEVRGMEWDAQWDLAKADPMKAQHIFIFYWWPTILSGYDFLVNMFHTEEEIFFNLGYYYNSEFDDLIDTAYSLEATDPEKALELYREAQKKLVEEDCAAIFFYDLMNTHVIREAIGGYVDNPAYPHVVLYRDLRPPAGETTFRRAEYGIIVTDLDPSTQFSNEIVIIAGNMYEPLTWVTPEGEVIGVLAESWTVSEDGLTWDFKLRKGVKFHDGTPMDSTAVAESFERTKRMGMGAAFIWACVDEIVTFEEDPYLVRFKLAYPAPLDKIAAASYASWVFSPKVFEIGDDDAIAEWLNGPPPAGIFAGDPPYDVGTGPYYLAEWEPGHHVVLKRFEDYWGGWEDGPYYDTIYIENVEEPATREEGILGEAFDWTYMLPKEDLKAVDESPVADVIEIPSFQNLLGLFNTKRPPTDNVLVRKAIAYAVPYQAIIDEALLGYGVQSRGPVPAGLFGHIEDLFQYTHNLEKARELLREAGYTPPASAMAAAGSMAYIELLVPCFYVMTCLVKREWEYTPT